LTNKKPPAKTGSGHCEVVIAKTFCLVRLRVVLALVATPVCYRQDSSQKGVKKHQIICTMIGFGFNHALGQINSNNIFNSIRVIIGIDFLKRPRQD
jgi:hypothetical protein